MMEKQQVTQLYDILMDQNEGKTSKQLKLTAIHKVCEGLSKKGLPIEIANVVKHLAQSGTKMGKQSLYNKQDGNNPYRKLIDAWGKCSAYEKQKTKVPTISSEHESLITERDLAEIKNPVLRYKLSLMYGEVTALRSQNNMLRDIKNIHAIQSVPVGEIELADANRFMLDDYEIEILESFVESNGSLGFNEDGRLFAKTSISRGTLLSDDDLKPILDKVLRSYGRDTHE